VTVQGSEDEGWNDPVNSLEAFLRSKSPASSDGKLSSRRLPGQYDNREVSQELGNSAVPHSGARRMTSLGSVRQSPIHRSNGSISANLRNELAKDDVFEMSSQVSLEAGQGREANGSNEDDRAHNSHLPFVTAIKKFCQWIFRKLWR
jgi:hypothetical protein